MQLNVSDISSATSTLNFYAKFPCIHLTRTLLIKELHFRMWREQDSNLHKTILSLLHSLNRHSSDSGAYVYQFRHLSVLPVFPGCHPLALYVYKTDPLVADYSFSYLTTNFQNGILLSSFLPCSRSPQ